MDRRIQINLENWGITFEELNEMNYEKIKELKSMNKTLLFAVMNAITNIETIREYLQDNKRSLV